MNRAKVLFADLVTKFGDWISLIGLNYYFFLKGQWAAIAIFSGLQLAIPIFISPISLFVRGNIYLKKTLILSNLFRALFMFFITLLIAEKSNVIIIIFYLFVFQ